MKRRTYDLYGGGDGEKGVGFLIIYLITQLKGSLSLFSFERFFDF